MAALDAAHPLHRPAARVLSETDVAPSLSPFILAELDYLIMTRVGSDAALALLDEVSQGTYRLEPFSTADVSAASEVCRRYAGSGDIGLADASLVVLARRHDTLDLLTLDERHFRTLRGPDDRPFRLLPADL